jgi:hypothetical protein
VKTPSKNSTPKPRTKPAKRKLSGPSKTPAKTPPRSDDEDEGSGDFVSPRRDPPYEDGL